MQGTGNRAGFHIADVLLYPLQYVPAQRRLELYTEITFTLSYAEQGQPTRLSRRQMGRVVSELTGLVANPKDIPAFAPQTRATIPGDLDYVVITGSSLSSSFEPLLNWYRRTGLNADVKTREWITANYPGVDVPEQIRNFIIDYYQNHGLSYVLLAGDTQIVPCRRARATAGQYVDDLPCDLYYADLQWSWNGNHDTVWGEFGNDTVDFYSEVNVGRAPVDDTTQAQSFVHKVLSYELNPTPGYLTRVLLPYTALYSFYPARLSQDSIAAFVPPGWQTSIFTGMTTTSPIHDSLESGYGLVHVVAHGNNTGFYTMSGTPIYSTAVASSQTNAARLPVLTSIACYAGNFEWNECLAEALMNNPHGGAVATIMNSRYGIAQPPGCGPAERLDIRFYDYLFHYDSLALGIVHSRAKDYYAAIARTGGIWQWSVYELNLFGDPLMPAWTAEPGKLFADCPRVLNPGAQQLRVTVTDKSLPIDGASVRVFHDSDFSGIGTTGPDGVVNLSINPQTPGRFYIIALARNGIPFQDSGIVRTSGAYVAHLRHSLDDSAPYGNGDGIVNPGERVWLRLWLRNFGNQSASGLTAHLRCSDTTVVVLDSLSSYGTLAPGDSALGTTFSFSETCDYTNGRLIPFRIAVSDDRDSTWDSQIQALVGTSVLTYDGCTVIDTLPGGNRNSRLDPGETAQLEVRLLNLGIGNGYSVAARLRSTDSRLAALDSLGSFGTIYSDSSNDNHAQCFRVHADSTIPLESSIPCSLVVSAAGEPDRTLGFSLFVGQIRTCDPVPDTGGTTHRYWAFDDGDTSYRQCPTYDWVEISNRGTLIPPRNDTTAAIGIPFGFYYFGLRYNLISICSNGWLAPGYTIARNWVNHRLPDGLAPYNLICANWDDFDPTIHGRVWYYPDTAGHRFIVEWDSVAYHDTTGAWDNFEIVLYDSTRPTPTGDCEFLFQYQTANYYGSSSIGIENGNSTIGIRYLFDSLYHRAAATIMPSRAILFTTSTPSAIAESPSPLTGRGQSDHILSLSVLPSLGNRFVISYSLPDQVRGHDPIASIGIVSPDRLAIYDITGRCIKSFPIGLHGDMTRSASDRDRVPGLIQSLPWNGTDFADRPVAPGVYFAVLRTGRNRLSRKLLLVR